MQEQNRHKWTPEEKNRLIELNRLGSMSAREIGEQLGGLTREQVYSKKRTLLPTGEEVAKRKLFTVEEDEKLKNYCSMFKKKNGDINWFEVVKHMPGRTKRQCRDRWHNYFSSDINSTPWTTEDDEIIINNLSEFGITYKTFKLIQQKLPNRSLNSIKNHYNKSLKGRLLSSKRKNRLLLNQTEALGNSINDINTQLTNEQEQNNNQNQNDNRNNNYFSLNDEHNQNEDEDFFSFSAILDQMAADEEKNDDFPHFYNFDY